MKVMRVLLGLFLALPSLSFAQSPNQRLEMGAFFTFSSASRKSARPITNGDLDRRAGRPDRVAPPAPSRCRRRTGGTSKFGRKWTQSPGIPWSEGGRSPWQDRAVRQGETWLRLLFKGPVWCQGTGLHLFQPTMGPQPGTSIGRRWIECYLSNGLVVRFDLADTIVNYNAREVVVSAREPPRPVAGFTTRNRQWSLGVGKRF